MNKIEARNYNYLAKNPIKATINCFKKQIELGKILTREEVEREVKLSKMYSDKKLKDEDILEILTELSLI